MQINVGNEKQSSVFLTATSTPSLCPLLLKLDILQDPGVHVTFTVQADQATFSGSFHGILDFCRALGLFECTLY